MNIFDRYGSYRCQHAAEFRKLLEAVAKSVLTMTENFPEEESLDTFKTSSDRMWFNCEEMDNKDGFLSVGFSRANNHQYPYDDTATKELDRFMETYYPYIVCLHDYSMNLYERTFEFHFEFYIDYDNEESIIDKGLKIANSIELFNNDIAEVLQQKFDYKDWDLFEYNRDKRFYESGIANICIEIN